MHRAIVKATVVGGIGLLALSSMLFSQPAPAGGGGGAVGGGGGMVMGGGGVRMMAGVGNPAQHRQQQLDAIKSQLEVTDDEWDKISPKVEKVLDAKTKTATGAGLSWSSMNGAPPVFKVSEANLDTPAGKVMQEIRAALDDKSTPPEEITKKLAALKDEIEKARAELQAARQELNDALTPRQQAILATMAIGE